MTLSSKQLAELLDADSGSRDSSEEIKYKTKANKANGHANGQARPRHDAHEG